MDKENVVYNTIQYNLKNEGTPIICNDMDES